MAKKARITRCPACKKRIPHFYIGLRPGGALLGSKRRQCRYCGHVFFDNAYHELAIYYSLASGIPLDIFPSAWYMCVTLYTGGYFLLHFPEVLATGTLASIVSYGAAMIFFLALAVISTRHVVRAVYRKVCKEAYEKKFQRDKWDILRGYKEPPHSLAVPLKESMRRLQDREYLYFLEENGVTVPQFFLDRAGIFPNDERLVCCREEKEYKARLVATMDRIRGHNREKDYYESYLSMDPKSQMFLQGAKEHRMPPAMFEQYCRDKAAESKARIDQEVRTFRKK